MREFIEKYWLQVGFGVVISLLGYANRKLMKKMREQEAMKRAMQALLRDRIIHSYYECKKTNYCPVYVMDNVNAMFKEYEALEGNGTVPQLVKEMRGMDHSDVEERLMNI